MPGAEVGVAQLARARRGEAAYLQPHHLAAAQRVERLFARAHLAPRVTMAYAPSIGAHQRGAHKGTSELSDMASDARKALAGLHAILPADCAGVVVDACGYGKGLQQIEAERGWPRRSAKLVLRIGLDHLARHYGLAATAEGPQTLATRRWLAEDGRPCEVG